MPGDKLMLTNYSGKPTEPEGEGLLRYRIRGEELDGLTPLGTARFETC